MNRHHANFLRRWWLLSYGRHEMVQELSKIQRYVVCGQVTKRPVFAFISSDIRPNAALIVFPLADDYSFGILQSNVHWSWFKARCSTLKGDFRYTSNTVFDSFPWPQSPTAANVRAIAQSARELRNTRRHVMSRNDWSFRDLYRSLELPGENPVNTAHDRLDAAVMSAYGFSPSDDILERILELNHTVADKEALGEAVIGPGLPPTVTNADDFFSDDAIGISTP